MILTYMFFCKTPKELLMGIKHDKWGHSEGTDFISYKCWGHMVLLLKQNLKDWEQEIKHPHFSQNNS